MLVGIGIGKNQNYFFTDSDSKPRLPITLLAAAAVFLGLLPSLVGVVHQGDRSLWANKATWTTSIRTGNKELPLGRPPASQARMALHSNVRLRLPMPTATATHVRCNKRPPCLHLVYSWGHGLRQQSVWVSFWTPKPLKSTPQDTPIFLSGIFSYVNLKLINEIFSSPYNSHNIV